MTRQALMRSMAIASVLLIGAAALSSPVAAQPKNNQRARSVYVVEGLRGATVRAYLASSGSASEQRPASDFSFPYVSERMKNYRVSVAVGGEERWLRTSDVRFQSVDCAPYVTAKAPTVGSRVERGLGEACQR